MAIRHLSEADWDESKHPRKRDGKFAPKGQGESGGAKPKAKPPKGYEAHEVVQHASWTRGRLPTVTHHEGKLWAHTKEGVRAATPEDLMPAIRAKASNPEHRLHALVHGGGQPPSPRAEPEPGAMRQVEATKRLGNPVVPGPNDLVLYHSGGEYGAITEGALQRAMRSGHVEMENGKIVRISPEAHEKAVRALAEIRRLAAYHRDAAPRLMELLPAPSRETEKAVGYAVSTAEGRRTVWMPKSVKDPAKALAMLQDKLRSEAGAGYAMLPLRDGGRLLAASNMHSATLVPPPDAPAVSQEEFESDKSLRDAFLTMGRGYMPVWDDGADGPKSRAGADELAPRSGGGAGGGGTAGGPNERLAAVKSAMEEAKEESRRMWQNGTVTVKGEPYKKALLIYAPYELSDGEPRTVKVYLPMSQATQRADGTYEVPGWLLKRKMQETAEMMLQNHPTGSIRLETPQGTVIAAGYPPEIVVHPAGAKAAEGRKLDQKEKSRLWDAVTTEGGGDLPSDEEFAAAAEAVHQAIGKLSGDPGMARVMEGLLKAALDAHARYASREVQARLRNRLIRTAKAAQEVLG